jgi:predicted RNase H-like nuclease (RuvC/YqgF family)
MTPDVNEILAALIAIVVTASGFFAVLKFQPVRNAIATVLSGNVAPLKEALESLQAVVEAQGKSIDWLRSELDHARAELELAKKAMAENATLRERVAELEEQVRQLESELERRRKYTPKKYRGEQ